MPRERPDRPSSTHNKTERAAFSGMLTTRQLNLTESSGATDGRRNDQRQETPGGSRDGRVGRAVAGSKRGIAGHSPGCDSK